MIASPSVGQVQRCHAVLLQHVRCGPLACQHNWWYHSWEQIRLRDQDGESAVYRGERGVLVQESTQTNLKDRRHIPGARILSELGVWRFSSMVVGT